MLGSRIAALRSKKGLSQAALAQRLHISPSAVGMYEQGRREPSGEILVALSEEFHVSVDYLLTGRGSPAEMVAGLSQPISGFQSLTREELLVLLAALMISES